MALQPKDLFEANTEGVWETFMAHNGSAGYKVPEYQRPYSWSKDNVDRLLQDCLNGFARLTQSGQEGFSFLGSILLTIGGKEPSFTGVSLLIVDGQQRLTTIVLTACALFELISQRRPEQSHVPTELRAWLSEEVERRLVSLRQCALGQIQQLDGNVFYPRLVRMEDHRSASFREAEYRSPVASFLGQFHQYATGRSESFPGDFPKESAGRHVHSMYAHIRERLNASLGPDHGDSIEEPLEIAHVSLTDFTRSGYADLWRRLEARDQDHRHRQIAALVGARDCEGLTRLLLFSSFFLERVVLTRIETRDEEHAFDMFDALNTTGEPLTALQTCKPLVVAFEEGTAEGYDRSPSRRSWESIESTLESDFPDLSRRQTESKRMVTSFALYIDGRKLPEDVASQRAYLRDGFRRATRSSTENARRFVHALNSIADYRAQCWRTNAIDRLSISSLSSPELDELRVCLRFISDSNTALSVPILARYWVEHGDDDPESSFYRAARVVAAFLALRRATTGGTGRIDDDLRGLMADDPGQGGDPLSVGITFDRSLLSPEQLAQQLLSRLKLRQIQVENQTEWRNAAAEVEFGSRAPQALKRLLLLAASHNSRQDDSRPGMLTRDDVTPGADIQTLTHAYWTDDRYGTVEHIAPESDPGHGWSHSIYRRQATRQLIGNLTLLPSAENQSIGNAPWERKRRFYTALASPQQSVRDAVLEEATQQGKPFGRRTRNLLRSQERLQLLEPIVAVDDWTEEIVHERTRNVLDLAWERMSPWLLDP